MADTYILDASAVIAVLRHEKGCERVRAVLGQAVISTVNVAEARSKFLDYGYAQAEIDQLLFALDVREAAFSPSQARVSGILRNATRNSGLSLGDRACLALAMEQGGIAMTTDTAWKQAELPVQVEMLR